MSANGPKGRFGYSRPLRLRKCNTCGLVKRQQSSGHRYWDSALKTVAYCGYMRVMTHDEEQALAISHQNAYDGGLHRPNKEE